MAKTTFPAAWGLTPLESAYLTALRPGKIVGVDQLVKLHASKPANPAKRVRYMIGQLRRKTDPLDIEIATKWGEGWVLQRAARQRMTTLLRGA